MKTLDPKNYPPVPAGFSDPIQGPLDHPASIACMDLAYRYPDDKDDDWAIGGWGSVDDIYALRLGSPVALANGIAATPPEPDRIERTLAALCAELESSKASMWTMGSSEIEASILADDETRYQDGIQFAINLLTSTDTPQ